MLSINIEEDVNDGHHMWFQSCSLPTTPNAWHWSGSHQPTFSPFLSIWSNDSTLHGYSDEGSVDSLCQYPPGQTSSYMNPHLSSSSFPPQRSLSISSTSSLHSPPADTIAGPFGAMFSPSGPSPWNRSSESDVPRRDINTRRQDIYCVFCKNNGAPAKQYKTHSVKDNRGNVICPVLRRFNCPNCNNGGGDMAHTVNYCPRRKADKLNLVMQEQKNARSDST